MKWSNNETDHMKSISAFDKSKNEELRETFSWKNTNFLWTKFICTKELKFFFLDFRLEFIKGYQVTKLNEEGFN